MAPKPGSICNDNNRSKERLLVYLYSNPLVRVNETRAKVPEVLLSNSREMKMIKGKLDKSGLKFRYRCDVATLKNLGERLDEGCAMLHYAGHGNGECLSFESEEYCGVMQPITVTSLTNMFRNRRAVPKLVFCASCDSRKIGEALVEAAGVCHVVAVDGDQTDKVAQDFSAAFYNALVVAGETIKGAFLIAREKVNAAAANVGTGFVLLPEGGNHDVNIFDTLPTGKFEDLSPHVPYALTNARQEHFGTVPLQCTVDMLCDPNARCTSVVGEPGSGKTQIALKACEYVLNRHRFEKMCIVSCKNALEARRLYAGEHEDQIAYLCRLIWTEMDKYPPVPTTPEMLINSLVGLRNGSHSKVLLFLDDADYLFGKRGGEMHNSLVMFLDRLFCRNSEVRVLLTGEEYLLEDTNIVLQNTCERVLRVKPLEDTDTARLLLHLFPRDGCGFKCKELRVSRSLPFSEKLKVIAEHPVLKEVRGHPGTLVKLGPKLAQYSLANEFDYIRQLAIRIRTEFQDKRRKFSEQRAEEIATRNGLRDARCRRVWVKAAARAAADGGGIFGQRTANRGPRRYEIVPLQYLVDELDIHLCEVQSEHGRDRSRDSRSRGGGRIYHPLVDNDRLNYMEGYPGGTSLLTESFTPRSMEPNGRKFVSELLEEKEKAISGGGNHSDVISIRAFVVFCGWWTQVMVTISRVLPDWLATNPIRIHGFVGGERAEEMLQGKDPGTFLIRFSSSQPGVMAFSHTKNLRLGTEASLQGAVEVEHCLVTVYPQGEWGHDGTICANLHELARKLTCLRKVHPDIPKELVFNDARKEDLVEVPQTPTPATSPSPVSAEDMLVISMEYMLLFFGMLMGMLGLTVLWITLRGL